MRSLNILALCSTMLMMMEVESKPATFLVETADTDDGGDHWGQVESRRRVNKINVYPAYRDIIRIE